MTAERLQQLREAQKIPEENLISRMINPTWLTNAEAAEYIGISPTTLVNWRGSKRHVIPYTKVGGGIRHEIAGLDAWLESQREEG